MTPLSGLSDAERLRGLVARNLGLHFEDGKLGFLEERLGARLQVCGSSAQAYLDGLEGAVSCEEWGALAADLTVPETYFFRNLEQFRAFADLALPEGLKARGTQTLRVLSAGCASGEEPYSLAILAREAGGPGLARVIGVDVNPRVLAKARRGRYTPWALRETPKEIQTRWFRAEGRDFQLENTIRDSVQIELRNLKEEDPEFWKPESIDILFCRNVLMYFTPEAAVEIVARFSRALRPGGHLFLGHAETLRGLSQDFHLCHTHGTFYYQKKEIGGATATHPSSLETGGPEVSQPLASVAEAGISWVEVIQRASTKILALSEPSGLPNEPRGVFKVAMAPSREWVHVLDLLRKERFNEALDFVEGIPSASFQDLDGLLLRAALLTHGGRLTLAEETCRALLDLDECQAGAHFLLALCREGGGDRAEAISHDQAAAYLDPGFAMPRLHLGLMARRVGDFEGMRREWSRALALLPQEDPARILLFGGGFSREALMALCRSGLQGEGGRP